MKFVTFFVCSILLNYFLFVISLLPFFSFVSFLLRKFPSSCWCFIFVLHLLYLIYFGYFNFLRHSLSFFPVFHFFCVVRMFHLLFRYFICFVSVSVLWHHFLCFVFVLHLLCFISFASFICLVPLFHFFSFVSSFTPRSLVVLLNVWRPFYLAFAYFITIFVFVYVPLDVSSPSISKINFYLLTL